MKIVSVRLGNRSYNVFIGAALKDLGRAIKRNRTSRGFQTPQKALVITQPFAKSGYVRLLEKSLCDANIQPIFSIIPSGEKVKNLRTVEKLYHECVKGKLDRTSCIIAFGGGVVGDIAGFVAATYLRGIPLVQVPTTLIAMVDSSIGGKTGVDLPEAKNFVGSFYQPVLVWMDPSTLESLPDREMRNGMAEVIKYGIISDEKLFKLLEKSISYSLPTLVTRCVKIKADIVSKDEREIRGLREILNFGHTLGHAIETVTNYTTYKHGEAISIGMCAAGSISERMRLWRAEENVKMQDLIRRAGLPVRLKKILSPNEILGVLKRDKKVRAGELRCVLPVRIGKVIVKKIPPELVLKGLETVQP